MALKDQRSSRNDRCPLGDVWGSLYRPKTILHNIRKCVEKSGLIVNELVITPLALTESILSDGEKDFGTIVIDIGGGQTTTSVMHDKQLKFTHVNQEGGEFVTKRHLYCVEYFFQ